MDEGLYTLVPSFLWGLILGTIYFGGLWFSIRFLLYLERGALWMSISFLTRNLIVVAGFYWVMNGQWQILIASLTGFLLIRVAFVNYLGKQRRLVVPSETGK